MVVTEMGLSDHSAPGTAAAFDYQFERALYWLAKSHAGTVVGIETDDDVTVRSPEGDRVLEQDKHSISANIPFGDRSKDLWNTLDIWVTAVANGEVCADSARFFMVTNKAISTDSIAFKIGCAHSTAEIDACVDALLSAGTTPPPHIESQVNNVLLPKTRSILREVISHCEVVDASDVAHADLRKSTAAHLQLPQWCLPHTESILNELLGWLHSCALRHWQKNEPAWILRDHFVNQLHEIISNRRRQLTRERAAHLIPVSPDAVGRERASFFVRQLHLVTEDDTVVDTAIREFVRCNIEKTRLSVEGNVTDADWTTFEATLHSRWDKIRARVNRMKLGTPENDVGFEIFTETTEDYREKLAGQDTEQVYLTSGTYHRLADLLRLGWHPRFATLMSSPQESDDD